MNNPNKENEEIVEEFWKMLASNQFVKSTDVITDEVKHFPPAILDMEAVVRINGEFDKYAIDEWLLSKDQKIQDLKTIPSEALIQELINRGYTKIEDISPE